MTTAGAPVPWYRTTVKVASLGVLVLVLLVPAAMVRSLVVERQARQASVVAEVGRLWGRPQTLLGPVLSLPYDTTHTKVRTTSQGMEAVQVTGHGTAHVLPEALSWTARIDPETRSRGIFDVVVFTVHLHAEGQFRRPDLAAMGAEAATPRWGHAVLAIGVSDLRGLREQPRLAWDGTAVPLLSGTDGGPGLDEGLHAVVPGLATASPDQPIPFTLDLVLGGSGALEVVPVGDDTTVKAGGSWPAPSFVGAFLPRTRRVTPEGFTATWEVPALSRGFPAAWLASDPASGDLSRTMRDAAFGVALVIPADGYQQSERATKYAILFLGLTFMTFFLLELASPTRLHPVQYLLVGMALCLFYLLLLALSEHLGFTPAYVVAAAATIALIATYAASVFASRRYALLLAAALGLLYGFLYVVLRSEDYALLIGAVALFGVLALVMRLTRRLDWYTLEFGGRAELQQTDPPPLPGPVNGC